MAIALVAGANTIAGSVAGNTITTPAITTTGADLIVVGIADLSLGAKSTLSDSKSNSSWVELTEYSYASHPRGRLFYHANPTVGASHTFTATTSVPVYPSIVVAAFSGALLVSPLDTETGHGNVATGTTVLPGSITPAEAGELLVTMAGWEVVTPPDASTMSIDNGFAITDQLGNGAGGLANYGVALAYLVHTSGAMNPTWTQGQSSYLTAAMAAFKAAAASSAGPLIRGRLVKRGILQGRLAA